MCTVGLNMFRQMYTELTEQTMYLYITLHNVYSWTEHVQTNVHRIDRTENVTVHYIA